MFSTMNFKVLPIQSSI